ncbi:hypothetical protein EMIHUDRAFT_106507 [Emiliania huxleyi CCMP1516]|uniref:HECT domain-containing protein n=2 Tax=Emiliania huxleyi TaxID=2903 RepID=A0A0D3I875_EMIH1|nr:hypothetical protein EMIHUDRAFT_106507 [Emiliania huxleyi CCMP1516]EOD07460.1 hypothetical protein EMIHUDRAFT_106507 [Emiliania huxleyi CCMP1516]|eukprot:XP_005759889.1 hypothetical protein EMIHUDRAFT_106507 [Emiliania huxleyi CCMP1516]
MGCGASAHAAAPGRASPPSSLERRGGPPQAGQGGAEQLASIHLRLDELWAPLLDSVEARLSGAEDSRASWDSLTPRGLVELLFEASGALGAARWAGACETEALLALLLEQWTRRLESAVCAEPASGAPPEADWVNSSLRRLLALLGVAFFRVVSVEDEPSIRAKLACLGELEARLGLQPRLLSAALGPQGKALLLYVDACVVADSRFRLPCERATALWDTFALWSDSPHRVSPHGSARSLGSAKLYPQFRSRDGGLEHGEGHGPRKEYFALIGEHLARGGDGRPALLPYDGSHRQHWFDGSLEQSAETEALLRCSGWLLAQAVCNRCTVEILLPTLLFAALCAEPGVRPFAPSLDALAGLDPQAAASVRAVLRMGRREFEEMAALEGLAGLGREQYAERARERLAGGGEGGWQLKALREGFQAVLPPAMLRGIGISPTQLCAIVCGEPESHDRRLRDVFRVVEDAALAGCPPLREALWAVLDGWTEEEKRRLLAFCTGSDRWPQPGTAVLSVQLPFAPRGRREEAAMALMMPQAHTCDNVLELPNYYLALAASRGEEAGAGPPSPGFAAELRSLIHDRFSTAVSHCACYGLDDLGGAGPAAAAVAARRAAEQLGIGFQADRDDEPSASQWSTSLDSETVELALAEASGGAPVERGDASLAARPSSEEEDGEEVTLHELEMLASELEELELG